MQCSYHSVCGGCPCRNLSDSEYRELKLSHFKQTLQHIHQNIINEGLPRFIADGTRRRASFTFQFKKKTLLFGFNANASHNIVNIDSCLSLTPAINRILLPLKEMIKQICSIPYSIKKGKKLISQNISQGDVLVCEADNGLDIVLEYDAPIDVNVRMIVAEFIQDNNDVIRISHRCNPTAATEILLQKSSPVVKMGNYDIKIPAGTFLQPSQQGEQALAELVVHPLREISGNIADLFCGVGTFSYYIASAVKNIKISSIDSGTELLQGFKDSLNSNQISNITVKKQNLFKYPLSADEISNFNAIVFDPPRSGAKELCRQIALATKKPEIIVAVSCNPLTFTNDANTLIDAGYYLQEITLVDQFVYSNHSELVALFKLP